jgi:hypothetical protein
VLTIVGAVILALLCVVAASRMGLVFPRFGRWLGRKLGGNDEG